MSRFMFNSLKLGFVLAIACGVTGFSLKSHHFHIKPISNEFRLHVTNIPQSNSVMPKSQLPPWLPTFGTAALGGLLFGSDIGCSSSVVRIFGAGLTEFGNLDAFQLGLLASTSLFGAMAASGLLIFLGDKNIGRTLELKTASTLFIAGTLLQSLSHNLPLVLVGRLIFGLGIGTAMHVAPLYIAETAPDDLRGKLVSLKEAAIVGGIVLGYGAGALFGGEGAWQSVYQSVLPLEALMVVGALSVPESSRWLALRGRADEAVTALQTAQGITEAEAMTRVKDMVAMSALSDAEKEADDGSTLAKMKEILDSKYNRQALVIGVGLVLFQQLSGQPSVLYFANSIFQNLGMGYEAALGVGVFKLAMTLVSSALVEDPKWGRRSLLLVGNAGVTASLTALTALYALAPEAGPNQAAVIACILVFVGAYQIGFGPITWLILSEIFPLRIRSAAVSIGTLANFGSNLLVTLLFEAERKNLGESTLFFQFAVVALAATVFTNKYVFETRGLSLEEIEGKLKRIVDGESVSATEKNTE